MLDVYAVTDAGSVRPVNEDNYYVSGRAMRRLEDSHMAYATGLGEDLSLLAVCDGMGGEACGEYAALAAVEALQLLPECSMEENGLRNTQTANQAVLRVQKEHGSQNAGCTLAALLFQDGQCQCFNIGDSRVYHLRGNTMEKMSYDHSVVQQLVELGIIRPEDADTHPDRSKLTQALGIETPGGILRPAFSEIVTPQAGDKFLVCSDGLYEKMSQDTIRQILQQEKSCEQLGNELLDGAIRSGSTDNITVIVAAVI